MSEQTLVEFIGGPMDGEQKWVAGEPNQIDFPFIKLPSLLLSDGDPTISAISTISYCKVYGHYMNRDGVCKSFRYEFKGHNK